MDEMWSFVGSKQEKVWIWRAQDEDTREVVGCAMGDRSAATAQQLWDSLPPVYRQCAFIHTDFWDAYAIVLPAKRYKAVGKETGKPAILSALIILFVNAYPGLFGKRFLFRKKLNTIGHPFGISFITITHPSGFGHHDFHKTTQPFMPLT